jgi:hypothetical protein
MRLLVIIAALLLAAVPAGAQPGHNHLERKYDELESCTTVNALVFRYGPGGGRNLFTMDAFAMHRGSVPPREPIREATFSFGAEYGMDEDGFGGSDPALSLVVDDSVALRYPARGWRPYDAQYLRGGLHQRLYAHVPAADLARIARAARVTGTIGERPFALDGTQIGILRQLSDFMARSPGAQVPVHGGFDHRDCDSFSWSPNYLPYDPEKDDAPRR